MSTASTNKIVAEYEAVWYHADFWPGEYPPRFSVTKDEVVLIGRAHMKLTSPKDVYCPVPKFATYSPWNSARNTADKLQYKTVSKPSVLTITDTVEVLALTENEQVEVTLNLQKGDTLQFLVYHAEGFGLYRYNDNNFVIDQGDFKGKEQFEENARKNDLWVEMPAEHGNRCWILYSDAIAVDGIIEPNIEGYGIANDLPDPEKLSLDGVVFVSGQTTLTDASKKILNKLANKLRRVDGVEFDIGGHTDDRGSEPGNQALSQKRAEAVADYLVDEAGVDYKKLRPMGYGESQPIADNGTAEGRAANRRVELNIL